MNKKKAAILFLSGFLSAASLASPGFLHGQAPEGPLPPAAPQPPEQAPAQRKGQEAQQPRDKLNLSGAWNLNRDESDDPRKKMQEGRGSSRSGTGGGPYGGGRRRGGGFPFPGGMGGGGPYGGRRGGSGSEGEQGGEDRGKMQGLLNPANSLTITQKDAQIDLTDDQSRQRVLYTDGRKLQKSKDDKYQEMAAHWEGSRLISEEKGPRGGKLIRSFELASDGKQLYETLHLESSRSGSTVVIRYVYDTTKQTKE
jgi:hypothetical protein